ncbi:hypothetical protein [Allorhodopirellula solitaria]|uniref:Uncharacterized protein n=1 Tax=Allorhodopirellula solitaria TaxID=2527987 RepID=A0A5C5XQQ0_9BACT|nr:hypothetical protein [Allorhodopirellula solitaria]TWT64821.1 hypothetical protein CA85_36060 [Allorhodopirellula solitaria]
MSQREFGRERPDEHLLVWLAVWSITLTVVIAALQGELESLAEGGHAVLGAAMGGLIAAWLTTLTWVALIELPSSAPSAGQRTPQRWLPRVVVFLAWLLNVIVLGVVARDHAWVLIQVLLAVALGILGPWIGWQWTHQRIHRTTAPPPVRRSIGHLLGIAFTIAVGSALLRMSDRWAGLTSSATALILSIALLWIVMLTILLSRWWGLMLITIPLIMAQTVTVSSMIDLRSPDADAEFMRSIGIIAGFDCFAVLFLLLMRSSGHRWLSPPD